MRPLRLARGLARRTGALLALGLVLAPAVAAADEDSVETLYEPPPPRQRSDFVLGLGTGLSLGRAVGYLNEAEKIGRPEYRESSGWGVGTPVQLWLGGALRDWLTFGFGLSLFGAQNGDTTAGLFAFITRLEGYPLFALGGPFENLGLFLDAGAGSSIIQRNEEDVADGGSMAYIGPGVVYEGLRFGHFAVGPTLAYVHTFSPSLTANFVSLGARIVYYGGP